MNDLCDSKESKWDPSSVDRIIYILTNRSHTFPSGIFPDNFQFQPWEEAPDVWLSIQKMLMLDRDNTDYYLKIALIILDTHKEILNKITNYTPSYDVKNFHIEESEFKNVEIINYGNRNSEFDKHSRDFPIPESFICEAVEGDSIKVTSNSEVVNTLQVDVLKTYGDPPKPLGHSILMSDWSLAFPFKGALKYQGTWLPGSVFSLTYIPKSIDYKAWVSAIEVLGIHVTFLSEVGLHQAYALSKQPTEKLAILYAALVKHADIAR